MVAAIDGCCVICMGNSGKHLVGKRCTASRCKAEYSARLKQAKTGGGEGAAAASPSAAPVQSQSFEIESLNHFKLWNLKKIYGRRTYGPRSSPIVNSGTV